MKGYWSWSSLWTLTSKGSFTSAFVEDFGPIVALVYLGFAYLHAVCLRRLEECRGSSAGRLLASLPLLGRLWCTTVSRHNVEPRSEASSFQRLLQADDLPPLPPIPTLRGQVSGKYLVERGLDRDEDDNTTDADEAYSTPEEEEEEDRRREESFFVHFEAVPPKDAPSPEDMDDAVEAMRDEKATVVLLLNPTGGRTDHWKLSGIAADFAERGCWVLLLDLRGQGRSDTPQVGRGKGRLSGTLKALACYSVWDKSFQPPIYNI